jgi:hypothetical protein
MANSLVGGIVSIVIGVIMVVNVFMPTVQGANTSTWSTSEVALYSVLGLAGIIGIVVGTFQVFGLV